MSKTPSGGYSQIPNEIIFSDLAPALFKGWCQLYSLTRNGESADYAGGLKAAAEDAGLSPNSVKQIVRRLKLAGAAKMVDGDLQLIIPTAESVKEAEQLSVVAEVQDAPNRQHTLTQKEAWELVKEAWNKEKPEQYVSVSGSFPLPWFIALETQAKRLGIEREDYGKFVGQVCRGAGADSWWSSKDMKFTSVFGYGSIKDRQFENVETLYKAGAKIQAKVDFNCDADVLARYAEAGRTDMTRVIRLEAADHFEAAEALNAIPASEYDNTAAYLFFAPGGDRPIHWSGKSRRSTMYLFS